MPLEPLVTHLASHATSTDGAEYTFGTAVNIDANALVLFTVNHAKGVNPDAINSIEGLTGATWVQVESTSFATIASPSRLLSVWRTMVGTSQNTVTLVTSFGGNTQTAFVGSIDQITQVATSGTNGSAAITQSTVYSSNGTSISITLPSTPAQTVWTAVGKNLNTAIAQPSGWTLSTDLGTGTPATRLMIAHSTTPAQTWTSTQPATAQLAIIGLEFNGQSTGGSTGAATINLYRRMLLGVGV